MTYSIIVDYFVDMSKVRAAIDKVPKDLRRFDHIKKVEYLNSPGEDIKLEGDDILNHDFEIPFPPIYNTYYFYSDTSKHTVISQNIRSIQVSKET